MPKAHENYYMRKKDRYVFLIVLVALLLIVLLIWVYHIRIKNLETKMKPLIILTAQKI